MSHIVIRQKLYLVRNWNFLILSAHFWSIAEFFFMSFEQNKKYATEVEAL